MSADNDLSRREFVKLVAGSGAAAAVAASGLDFISTNAADLPPETATDLLPSPESQNSGLEAWAYPMYSLDNPENYSFEREEDGSFSALNVPEISKLAHDPKLLLLVARIEEVKQLAATQTGIDPEEMISGAQPVTWEGSTYLVPVVFTPNKELIVPAPDNSTVQVFEKGQNSEIYLYPTFSQMADSPAAVPLKVTSVEVDGDVYGVQSVMGRDSDGNIREILDYEGIVVTEGLRIRNKDGKWDGHSRLSKGQRVAVIGEPTKLPGMQENFVPIATVGAEDLQIGYSAVDATNTTHMEVEETFAPVDVDELVELNVPKVVEPEIVPEDMQRAYDRLPDTFKSMADSGEMVFSQRRNAFVNSSGEAARPLSEESSTEEEWQWTIEYFKRRIPGGITFILEAPRNYFVNRGIPPYTGLTQKFENDFEDWQEKNLADYLRGETIRIVLVDNVNKGKATPIPAGLEAAHASNAQVWEAVGYQELNSIDNLYTIYEYPWLGQDAQGPYAKNGEASGVSRAIIDAMVAEYLQKNGELDAQNQLITYTQSEGYWKNRINELAYWPGDFSGADYSRHVSILTY